LANFQDSSTTGILACAVFVPEGGGGYHNFMATTTLLSFAEFERLDEGFEDIELLNGELIRMPYPQFAHMDTCERLFERMKSAVEHLRQTNPNLKLGRVHIEMGYRFPGEPGSGLKPDVSLTHPAQLIDRFYIGAPLIAFEVISESERALRLDEKVQAFLANGAAEVWLLYPGPSPDRGHALVHDGSATIRNETRSIHTSLLPGIDIPLNEIF
jgi:Uma2 family endonuclease